MFFIEYTFARNPSEFCNSIVSPPENFIILNENKMFKEVVNPQYNQSIPRVNQNTNFQSHPNHQVSSLSGTNKAIEDFDLNQVPSDAGE